MKRVDAKNNPELVGIVISGMPRLPQAPVVSAYVWGPAPSLPDEGEKKS